MKYFYVYILKCYDNSYYVGHTDNLDKRLAEHTDKKFSGYTATRLPFECVYIEKFQTKDEAFVVERRIKGWSRAKKEALIAGRWDIIAQLSNRK